MRATIKRLNYGQYPAVLVDAEGWDKVELELQMPETMRDEEAERIVKAVARAINTAGAFEEATRAEGAGGIDE